MLNVEIVLQVRQWGTGLDYAAFCNELTKEKGGEADLKRDRGKAEEVVTKAAKWRDEEAKGRWGEGGGVQQERWKQRGISCCSVLATFQRRCCFQGTNKILISDKSNISLHVLGFNGVMVRGNGAEESVSGFLSLCNAP